MKKLFLNPFTILAIGSVLYTGCTSNNPYKSWNDNLINEKAPVRLVKDKTFTKKNATRYIEDWAGVKGESIIDDNSKKQAFKLIEKHCGHKKENFIESRIVKYTKTNWEEVWLFQDEKSYRPDKISGLTVFFEYNTKTNENRTRLFGKCHTGRGTSFTNFN